MVDVRLEAQIDPFVRTLLDRQARWCRLPASMRDAPAVLADLHASVSTALCGIEWAINPDAFSATGAVCSVSRFREALSSVGVSGDVLEDLCEWYRQWLAHEWTTAGVIVPPARTEG